jgi:uncharacterized membrane protein
MWKREPKDDDARVYTHPGDYGVVIVAAMITIAMVLMLILPSPFARLEKAQAEQEKIERQKKIDDAVKTGEVSVGIVPAKKP